MADLLYGTEAGDRCQCEDTCKGHEMTEMLPPAAVAEAIAKFIIDLDDTHAVTPPEASRLWKALQARCPHPGWSDDDDGEGLSCDVCMAPKGGEG